MIQTFLVTSLLATGFVAVDALAQEAPADTMADQSASATQAGNGNDIVVTGTRDRTQTARQSVSPITVVSNAQLQATGRADLKDALTQLSPSITRPRISSGVGNLVDKINLRTLTSNQTLILINGKRRHTTAVAADTPGPENGASPVDLGMIPTSAIDHVEILQDGAAALYGSDAIAGVINIILKKNASGAEFTALNGAYYRGDGFSSGETVNLGLALGSKGFLNLSGEYRRQDHTNRSETDTRVNRRVSRYFGLPEFDRAAASYNAGYELAPGIDLYSFGTYAHRSAGSYQNYRLPSEAPALIPFGLNPLVRTNEDDYSVTGGIKGDLSGWGWDLGATYGGDDNTYTLHDSINQSLVRSTGTSPFVFDVGGYRNSQLTIEGSVNRGINLPGLAAPLNLTIGGQYRRDTYSVIPGEPASYFGAGTDGVTGLPLSSAVDASRTVKAVFADLSTKLLPQWQLAMSARYEDYTISGDVLTGKVSTRFDFSPAIAIRGTVSNGFRAPSMSEQYFTKIGVTSLGANGLLGFSSPGARLIGAPDLKPEKSLNYSASLLLNPTSRFNITFDAYQIGIKDRIVAAGTVNGAPAIAALLAQGVAVNASATASAVTVSYFTNAADTRTRGLDITANYHLPLGPDNTIDFDASGNINKTIVQRVVTNARGVPLLSTQGIAYLSTYFPRSKIVFGGNWKVGGANVNVHEIRWGPSTTQRQYYSGPFANSITVFSPFYNQPKWQTNVEVGYDFNETLRMTIGANNLFNEYPNRAPANTVFAGVAPYEQVGQGLDTQGGSYFFSLRVKM